MIARALSPIHSFWNEPTGTGRKGCGLIPMPLWLALVALIAMDIGWLALGPLRLSNDSLFILARMLPMALLCVWGCWRGRQWPRLALLCEGGLFLIAVWPALRLFNHLAMSTAFPLADAHLATMDRIIGFDWIAYLQWLDRHPALVTAMGYSYTSLSTHSALFFLMLLAGPNPTRDCRDFISLFFSSATLCCAIGLFFPALSAAIYHDPSATLFRHIKPDIGAYHLAHFTALRTDPDHILQLSNMPGLVTFPSFHTAMGVIAIYCCRAIPLLFAGSLVVNVLMIASTPLFGAHYLIDILAGATVAAVLILLQRGFRFTLTPRSWDLKAYFQQPRSIRY